MWWRGHTKELVNLDPYLLDLCTPNHSKIKVSKREKLSLWQSKYAQHLVGKELYIQNKACWTGFEEGLRTLRSLIL